MKWPWKKDREPASPESPASAASEPQRPEFGTVSHRILHTPTQEEIAVLVGFVTAELKGYLRLAGTETTGELCDRVAEHLHTEGHRLALCVLEQRRFGIEGLLGLSLPFATFWQGEVSTAQLHYFGSNEVPLAMSRMHGEFRASYEGIGAVRLNQPLPDIEHPNGWRRVRREPPA